MLNKKVQQYHVEILAVNIRGVQFLDKYEKKLMEKQKLVVQGKLDTALENKSAAVLLTDTLEKSIDKDKKLQEQFWKGMVEQARTKFEVEIAKINAAAVRYDQEVRSNADATCAKAQATGVLAETKAEALGQRLEAEALATRAGKTYSAIKAVEGFVIGDIQLNSQDPRFLYRFGSVDSWRKFFLPEDD